MKKYTRKIILNHDDRINTVAINDKGQIQIFEFHKKTHEGRVLAVIPNPSLQFCKDMKLMMESAIERLTSKEVK